MTAHLRELAAHPRFTGTEGNSRARDYCAAVLRRAGYEVREMPFEYSAFTGRFLPPAIGMWAAVSVYVTWCLAIEVRPGEALAVLGIAGGALGAFAAWVGGARVIDRKVLRREGCSLSASRGPDAPRIWLVAHIDSKWQPVSILVRALGVVVLSISAAALAVLILLSFIGQPVGPSAITFFAGAAFAGAIPLMLSFVADRSDGAADNASGVAATLLAAEQLDDPRIGVLITDAEELALAGAYAAVRALPVAVAINCDTIDDAGAFMVMTVGRRSGRVAGAFRRALVAESAELRVTRLIPGLLTDSVAFASAGWETATLSRGTVGTLGRIHTRSDDLGHLRGDGIPAAAEILARTAKALV